ncbi:MAG: 30S ribosomal protein S20 [Candidatus Paceibacterota bacterium]
MPITKSAKKQLRQNPKKKVKNDLRKAEMKKLLKQALALIEEKKVADLEKLLPSIYKAIDKACKTGVIKKNNAARKKSRIGKHASALKKAQ